MSGFTIAFTHSHPNNAINDDVKGNLAAVRYIRYADDFIMMMRDEERADELKTELADFIDSGT